MVECGFKSYAAFTIPGGSGGKMMLSGSSRYAKSNIPLCVDYIMMEEKNNRLMAKQIRDTLAGIASAAHQEILNRLLGT